MAKLSTAADQPPTSPRPGRDSAPRVQMAAPQGGLPRLQATHGVFLLSPHLPGTAVLLNLGSRCRARKHRPSGCSTALQGPSGPKGTAVLILEAARAARGLWATLSSPPGSVLHADNPPPCYSGSFCRFCLTLCLIVQIKKFLFWKKSQTCRQVARTTRRTFFLDLTADGVLPTRRDSPTRAPPAPTRLPGLTLKGAVASAGSTWDFHDPVTYES